MLEALKLINKQSSIATCFWNTFVPAVPKKSVSTEASLLTNFCASYRWKVQASTCSRTYRATILENLIMANTFTINGFLRFVYCFETVWC